HAPAALHAGLGHAAFRAVLLAQAEAGVLAPRIGEQVVVVAAVLPFNQPGVAGAGAGGVAALGAGVLGADLVGLDRPEARIHARQPAAAAEVLVADVGGAGLQLAVHQAHARAATGIEVFPGAAAGLVVHDHEHRVQVEVPARDRLAEEQRAVVVVDVVVQVPDQLARFDDALAVVAVAGLDAHALAVHQEPGVGQPVQPGGTVARQLVAGEILRGLG